MKNQKNNPVADIPTALNIPIGEVIKRWREFRELSVTELANQAQLTKGYISQIEHNRIKRPNDQQLAKLAGALGIDVWDIIARRMPVADDNSTENQDDEDQKGQRTQARDMPLPFGRGAFHFPRSEQTQDQLEEALIENLQETLRLLHARQLSPQQRREYIELIQSFFDWLDFRMTRNS